MSPLTAFQNTVGTRSLEGSERQALLDRLEKNGTPLEKVNEITTATKLEEPIEIKPDARTDSERKFDAANPEPGDASGYHLNLASVVSADAPMAAVQELEQSVLLVLVHVAAARRSLTAPGNATFDLAAEHLERAIALLPTIFMAADKIGLMDPRLGTIANACEACSVAAFDADIETRELTALSKD
jgi:hypothetical protein